MKYFNSMALFAALFAAVSVFATEEDKKPGEDKLAAIFLNADEEDKKPLQMTTSEEKKDNNVAVFFLSDEEDKKPAVAMLISESQEEPKEPVSKKKLIVS